jgi:hypothetical protein
MMFPHTFLVSFTRARLSHHPNQHPTTIIGNLYKSKSSSNTPNSSATTLRCTVCVYESPMKFWLRYCPVHSRNVINVSTNLLQITAYETSAHSQRFDTMHFWRRTQTNIQDYREQSSVFDLFCIRYYTFCRPSFNHATFSRQKRWIIGMWRYRVNFLSE